MTDDLDRAVRADLLAQAVRDAAAALDRFRASKATVACIGTAEELAAVAVQAAAPVLARRLPDVPA